MKKLFVLFLTYFVIVSLPGQENFKYPYNNVIKLSPAELLRSEFQMGYERYFINRNQSLNLLVSVFKGESGQEAKNGIQGFIQYRFYLSQLFKETHNTFLMYNIGFYAAPYMVALNFHETNEERYYDPNRGETVFLVVDESIRSLEAGALMGTQFDITSRIVLDLFIGGGIRDSSVKRSQDYEGSSDYGLLELGFSGIKPRIGLQIGITF